MDEICRKVGHPEIKHTDCSVPEMDHTNSRLDPRGLPRAILFRPGQIVWPAYGTTIKWKIPLSRRHFCLDSGHQPNTGHLECFFMVDKASFNERNEILHRLDVGHIPITEDKFSTWRLRDVFAELRNTHGIVASCHRFRHTTGTKLMRVTKNPKLVQLQLGHTSLNTTMKYVHPDIDEMRDLVSYLEQMEC
ncbi:tyrosine-type recombinase/integrase [Cupriavidus sp. 8B]